MNHPLAIIATWSLFAVCLALSFLLSGMEAGVFALSRLRIRQQMRAGRRSAAVLHSFLENPEHFLWTILVGNTVANFLILGWLLVNLRQALSGHLVAFAAVYIVGVFLFFALFDLLPKMLFRKYPTRLCIVLAQPFRSIHWLLHPLVWLVERCSDLLLQWRGGKAFTGHLFGNREELRMLMQESTPALTSDERVMINRVLDLQNLTVRQVMTPLAKAVTVSAEAPLSVVLALARERHVTRLPVWAERDGRPRIIGLVNLNSLLYQANLDLFKPVANQVKPALYLEEHVRLEDALRRMQRGGQRLAIVVGPDQREIGLISLQDALKAMFGEVSL